jgi:DNA-binding NarL/FixJ family response regulator
MNSYKTFLLEDSFFDLNALLKILEAMPQIQVVGSASSSIEALAKCEKIKPDFIIADAKIGPDKMAGATFVKNVRKRLPEVRILGLTYHTDLLDGLQRAGCDNVANKALIESPENAKKYIQEALTPKPKYYRDFAPPKLTEMQDRILKLICEGDTEDEIAQKLDLPSRKPVRGIKNTLFNIFGAKSAANLIYLAFKTGYLHPDRD